MASSKDARSPKFYVFWRRDARRRGCDGGLFPLSCAIRRSRTVREARAAVAERGPRIEVVTTAAGPTVRTIKLLGDVRSGATHDALFQGGRLSQDHARRQGRQGRGRAGHRRDRVARARSAICRRGRRSRQQAAQSRRASEGSTRRATRPRSPCTRRRPTRRWRRTTSPCWRPTSRIRPCGRRFPAA